MLGDPEFQRLIEAELSRNGHQPSPRFEVVQFQARDARPPAWAFNGYVKLGAINALIGVGGAGKGTFVSWLLARWSRGELPGEFHEQPIKPARGR
jgi:hypothetical protein